MMTQFDANFRKFTAQNGRAFVLLLGRKFGGGLGYWQPQQQSQKTQRKQSPIPGQPVPPKYDKVMLAGKIPDGLQLAQATLPAIPTAQDTAETEGQGGIHNIDLASGGKINAISMAHVWVKAFVDVPVFTCQMQSQAMS